MATSVLAHGLEHKSQRAAKPMSVAIRHLGQLTISFSKEELA